MSSTASTSNLGNEPPAPRDTLRDIDLASEPAIAEWLNQTSTVNGLHLDLHCNVESRKAFFRISARVAFKFSSNKFDCIYLFVYPELIESLTLKDNPETQRKLGSGTVCLEFILSTPATLFGPKFDPTLRNKFDLTPKNEASRDMLDALRALASQLSFSVYTNPSTERLPRRQLFVLCKAASQLRSIASHANPAHLYGGGGGQDLGARGLAGGPAAAASVGDAQDALHHGASSPPSGSKPTPSPQYSGAGPSRKRQRDASGNPRALVTPEIRKLFEDICDSRLADLKRDMTLELDGLKRSVRELEGLEHRVMDRVEKRLCKLSKDVMQKTGVIIDEEIEGLRSEIQDTIHDEVRAVDGNCVDQLSVLDQKLEDLN